MSGCTQRCRPRGTRGQLPQTSMAWAVGTAATPGAGEPQHRVSHGLANLPPFRFLPAPSKSPQAPNSTLRGRTQDPATLLCPWPPWGRPVTDGETTPRCPASTRWSQAGPDPTPPLRAPDFPPACSWRATGAPGLPRHCVPATFTVKFKTRYSLLYVKTNFKGGGHACHPCSWTGRRQEDPQFAASLSNLATLSQNKKGELFSFKFKLKNFCGDTAHHHGSMQQSEMLTSWPGHGREADTGVPRSPLRTYP